MQQSEVIVIYAFPQKVQGDGLAAVHVSLRRVIAEKPVH